MTETASFKPLKEFGGIATTEESELKFYIDEYKGFTYASIRTFLKTETYSGPTKAGITMNLGLLEKVVEKLAGLGQPTQQGEEKELARFSKKMGTELVVRLTLFKNSPGIDIREWVDDGDYKGWSKKGVRIQLPHLPKALALLEAMKAHLKSK